MKALIKSAIIAALALTFVGCEKEAQKHDKDKKPNSMDQGANKPMMDRDGQGMMQKDAPKPPSDY